MFDLVPWRRHDPETSPERSAVDLRTEMDNVFDRFFEMMTRPEGSTAMGFSPALDIAESDDEFIVRAELPGIDPSNVEISVTGDVLTIKGEKKHEKEENGERFHRVERSYGGFSRSLRLPCEILEDKIEARYINGVLDLRIPKAENAKRKTVKIEVKAA